MAYAVTDVNPACFAIAPPSSTPSRLLPFLPCRDRSVPAGDVSSDCSGPWRPRGAAPAPRVRTRLFSPEPCPSGCTVRLKQRPTRSTAATIVRRHRISGFASSRRPPCSKHWRSRDSGSVLSGTVQSPREHATYTDRALPTLGAPQAASDRASLPSGHILPPLDRIPVAAACAP